MPGVGDKQPTDFGWVLMEKIKEAGLTQSELARLTKAANTSGDPENQVSQATISRWVFSPGLPEAKKLRLVAPHLKMDPDVLLALAGHGSTSAEAMQTLTVMRGATRPAMDPLAERVNRLLDHDSLLTEQERADIERLVGGLVIQYEGYISQRRKRNGNRVG